MFGFEEIYSFFLPIASKTQSTLAGGDSIFDVINLILVYHCSAKRVAISRTIYLPNHQSWDVDAVKVKLGQKMAMYFFQGRGRPAGAAAADDLLAEGVCAQEGQGQVP